MITRTSSPGSLDFPPYVYIENGRIIELPTIDQPAVRFPGFLRQGPRQPGLVMDDCLDDLTRKATDVIRQRAKKDQPFFLYFPLSAPHKPVQPHPRFIGKSKLGLYGDFVMQVDWTVGQVMRAISARRASKKNTLLIYTSDNGSFMYRLGANEKEDHLSDPTTQRRTTKRITPLTATCAAPRRMCGRPAIGYRFLLVGRGSSRPARNANEPPPMSICLRPAPRSPGPSCRATQRRTFFSWLPLFRGGDWAKPRAPVINHSASGMFALRSGPWKLGARQWLRRA
ncbi:MAG: hypothetical protein Ct9H300mP7_5660 [Verrucomicrobiota bacterium]|nr:MAG: hypothetical protein Ct9H300mP7_5660 [Verrucomicrobiota bacterium]